MGYLIISFRVVTTFLFLMIVSLALGKRYLGELSIFDFVVAITLGSVAGANLVNPESFDANSLLAIAGLSLIHIILSQLVLKNRKIGHLITLDPTIVIQNGVILRENLSKIRYTVDDLMSQLREKDIFDLKEVEFAILEPNGTLSALKKSQYQPLTPRDIGISTPYKGLPIPLILEGQILYKGLNVADLSYEWLIEKLTQMGYKSPEEIFLALLDTQGELYISPQKPPLIPQQIEH